jgi:glycosyltransferase involved in cell wall biosynthesis
MRIGIDAAPLVGDRGGVGWHTFHLLQALLNLKEDIEFVGYVRPGSLLRMRWDEWDRWNTVRWAEAGQWAVGRMGARDGLDLYHGTNFKMQTTGRFGGVVTIHDLWMDRFPQYSRKLFGQRWSFYRTKRTVSNARKVITVSEYSAQDITTLYGVPREKIAVIHNGVSDAFRPLSDPTKLAQLRTRFGWPTDRFILFAGGADPRKNHSALLQAYAMRATQLGSHCLVMLGAPTHRFGNIHGSAQRFGLNERVICVGHLSADELRVLYAHADVFVFPSLYEGFGMPVLEAMASGAPVITSATTSLREVAGDAAVLIDPHSPEQLAEALVRVLTDRGLRETLRAKGFERAKQFTWQHAARLTFDVYREVCRSSGRFSS